jgi:hypothetical protein
MGLTQEPQASQGVNSRFGSRSVQVRDILQVAEEETEAGKKLCRSIITATCISPDVYTRLTSHQIRETICEYLHL